MKGMVSKSRIIVNGIALGESLIEQLMVRLDVAVLMEQYVM